MKNKIIAVNAKNLLKAAKEKQEENKDKTITFRLPNALKEEFEKIAKKNDLSVSKVLIKFIESFVESNKK